MISAKLEAVYVRPTITYELSLTLEYRLWVDGMDLDAKIDIQPGPTDLHTTFANIDLGSIIVDNQPLVPSEVPHDAVTAANAALNAISEVITGDVTATPDDTQYIYSSTSLHVARARTTRTPTKQVGRLQGKRDAAFCISFQGTLNFRYLSKEDLAAKKEEANVENLQISWSDIGEFFSNVANKIDSIIEITVDGINTTIDFLVDGIKKSFNLVLEFISEAAELAIFVFDSIKIGFQNLFDWLSFVFDWDDIQNTARAFQGMLVSSVDGFNVSQSSDRHASLPYRER